MSELLRTLLWQGSLVIGSVVLAIIGWKTGAKVKNNKEAKKLEQSEV